MNYKIYEDGIYTTIEETDSQVNGYNVFKTFGEAKRKVIAEFQDTIDDYKFALKAIKQLKKGRKQ